MKIDVKYSESIEPENLQIHCHPNHPHINEIVELIHAYSNPIFYPVKNEKNEVKYVR